MSDRDERRTRETFEFEEEYSSNNNTTEPSNGFSKTVRSLVEGMDTFISAKTVLGDPVQIDDTIVLPLVDVSFGVGAGAFGGSQKNINGNSGGGMHGKMSPSAVLVIKDGVARVVNVTDQDMISKVMNVAPDVIDKFSGLVKSRGSDKSSKHHEKNGNDAV